MPQQNIHTSWATSQLSWTTGTAASYQETLSITPFFTYEKIIKTVPYV